MSAKYLSRFDTPLGPMIAIGDDKCLHALEFADGSALKLDSKLLHKRTAPLQSIEAELDLYFQGKLRAFKTPLWIEGTPFQKQVWAALQEIPFGNTRSYSDLAHAIGRPTAFRAVAQANKRNRFGIIIPCHRVILSSGDLCGYNGGVHRKKWLLNHEGNCL